MRFLGTNMNTFMRQLTYVWVAVVTGPHQCRTLEVVAVVVVRSSRSIDTLMCRCSTHLVTCVSSEVDPLRSELCDDW